MTEDTDDRGPSLFLPRTCPLCEQGFEKGQRTLTSRNGTYVFHNQCMADWLEAEAQGTLTEEMWKRLPTAKQMGYTAFIYDDGTREEVTDSHRCVPSPITKGGRHV